MDTGSLLYVLAWMLRAYSYMLVVYVLLSWVMHEEHYPPIVRWLQSIVEPVLFQIRKINIINQRQPYIILTYRRQPPIHI